MARSTSDSSIRRVPCWKVRISALQSLFRFEFEDYFDSIWYNWERRIQQGHDAEEKIIERQYEKAKKQQSPDPYFDPDEWAGEDYMETCRLTSTMYAAMVVAMWARMEEFLFFTTGVCHNELNLKANLGSPLRIKKVCQFFLKALKLDIQAMGSYSVVNAIRILNNAFKHNGGRYEAAPKEVHDRINGVLLERWDIVKENGDIDYSKLPIKELVEACNQFSRDLLDRIEVALQTRLDGAGCGN